MIIRNVIRCNIYGDEIEFKHRHDCLRCCSKEEGCNTDISVIDHSRKKNNVSIDRESTVRNFTALCFCSIIIVFCSFCACAIMNPSEVIAMRILCFGDSNTYGYDPRGYFGGRYGAGDRWVDLLAKQTGHECINAGSNGREIPRNPYALRLLTEHLPVDVFLVMLGTNDLLQGASAKEAAARMEAFLNPLLTHCKYILLVAPPPMKRGAWVPTDELVNESIDLAEEYKLLAEKWNISFVDTREWNIELTFDGVHFTEEGHHAFADHLITPTSQNGRLSSDSGDDNSLL